MPKFPDHATRKAKVTPEHKAEAARLRELWKARTTLTQTAFGLDYDVGGQSAVGQFLRGEVPLSLKAGRGFARGLGVQLSDFSPRLAADASWPFEHVDKEMYDRLSQQAQGVAQARMQAEIDRLLGLAEDPLGDQDVGLGTGTSSRLVASGNIFAQIAVPLLT